MLYMVIIRISCNRRVPKCCNTEHLKAFHCRQTATEERREMIRELMSKVSRFLFTLVLFSTTTAYVILTAVPNAHMPALVAASIVAALIVAMYDIGVFRVECEI